MAISRQLTITHTEQLFVLRCAELDVASRQTSLSDGGHCILGVVPGISVSSEVLPVGGRSLALFLAVHYGRRGNLLCP